MKKLIYLFSLYMFIFVKTFQALEFIENNKDFYKIERLKPLIVSGAFHTSLMTPAVEPLTLVSNFIQIE